MPKPDYMRHVHDVNYQAKNENRRIQKAKLEAAIFAVIISVMLFFDYTIALTFFSAIDPTHGDVSLGPEILAISVPVAVVAIHLLIKEDKGAGQKFEILLKKLAAIGIVVFLTGMGLMFGLSLWDASDGLGETNNASIQGIIGNNDIGNSDDNISSVFGAIFSGISPIVFFAGMSLTLFITVYANHRLMLKLEERYRFFAKASRRSKELRELSKRIEELSHQIAMAEKKLATARKKLPADPEYRFAQIASSGISSALHGMKKSLRSLSRTDDVIESVFVRKASIPDHIKTRADGHRIISEIRHETTPFQILKHMDGLPPKEED